MSVPSGYLWAWVVGYPCKQYATIAYGDALSLRGLTGKPHDNRLVTVDSFQCEAMPMCINQPIVHPIGIMDLPVKFGLSAVA